jgi:hypothetical protein
MLQAQIEADWAQTSGEDGWREGRSTELAEALVEPRLAGSTETRKPKWKVTWLGESQDADLAESARTQFADSEEELQVCHGRLSTLGAQIESLNRALSIRDEEIRQMGVAHTLQTAGLTEQLNNATEAKARAEEEVGRLLIEFEQCRCTQERQCIEMLTKGQQQGREAAIQDCAGKLEQAKQDGLREGRAVRMDEGLDIGRQAGAAEAREEVKLVHIGKSEDLTQTESRSQDVQTDDNTRTQLTDSEEELQLCQSKLLMLGAQIEFMERDWERRATVIREEEIRRIESFHMQQIDFASETLVRAENELSLLQGELERRRMDQEQLWRATWTQGLQEGREAARQDWEERLERARQDGWHDGRAAGLKEGLTGGQLAAVADAKGPSVKDIMLGDCCWLAQSSSESQDEHQPAAAHLKLNDPEVELRLCQSKLVLLGAQIELMEKDWERRAAVIREEETRRIEAAHALQTDTAKEVRARAEEELRLLQEKLECCCADQERRCLEMWSQVCIIEMSCYDED